MAHAYGVVRCPRGRLRPGPSTGSGQARSVPRPRLEQRPLAPHFMWLAAPGAARRGGADPPTRRRLPADLADGTNYRARAGNRQIGSGLETKNLKPNPDGRDQLWICEHPPVFTQGLAGVHRTRPEPGRHPPSMQTGRGGQVI
jgi:hypothetical protein